MRECFEQPVELIIGDDARQHGDELGGDSDPGEVLDAAAGEQAHRLHGTTVAGRLHLLLDREHVLDLERPRGRIHIEGIAGHPLVGLVMRQHPNEQVRVSTVGSHHDAAVVLVDADGANPRVARDRELLQVEAGVRVRGELGEHLLDLVPHLLVEGGIVGQEVLRDRELRHQALSWSAAVRDAAVHAEQGRASQPR